MVPTRVTTRTQHKAVTSCYSVVIMMTMPNGRVGGCPTPQPCLALQSPLQDRLQPATLVSTNDNARPARPRCVPDRRDSAMDRVALGKVLSRPNLTIERDPSRVQANLRCRCANALCVRMCNPSHLWLAVRRCGTCVRHRYRREHLARELDQIRRRPRVHGCGGWVRCCMPCRT